MTSRRARANSRPANFADADRELADSLESLDEVGNYAHWIFDLLEPHLGPTVLEVGAGHGTFTELIAAGRDVVATELSQRCVATLHDRFDGHPGVAVLSTDVAGAVSHGPFDAAVLINVLEHIEDDDRALLDLAPALAPGGRLILWVPAFESLYSDFDRRVGHFRRYRVPQLRAKLISAGLEPVDIRYVNSLGAVAWWVVARQLRRTPTSRGSAQLFDRMAVPVVRRVERRIKMPFGQSILAVAIRRR